MSLALRLSKLREDKKETLQQVANAVKVSKAHIWELEREKTDNPSMALVSRLADHFGVTVSFLVGEDIHASDADEELARMFRQAKALDERERRILDDMMKTLLKSRPTDNAQ